MPANPVDQQIMDDKFSELESARRWSPRVISKLENLIQTAEDYELFRINPYTFAAETGMDDEEALDLFLHAAAAGLFEMEWHLICAYCAHVFKSFSELKNVYNHFICDFCYAENTPALDDYIHVSFTIAPQVRDISYRHPHSLSVHDLYYRYYFSKDVADGPIGMSLQDFVLSCTCLLSYLEPGEKKVYRLKITPGMVTGKDLGLSAGFTYFVSDDVQNDEQRLALKVVDGRFQSQNPALEPLTLDYGPTTFHFAQSAVVPGGEVMLEVENTMDQRNSLFVLQYPPDLPAVPLNFRPFLSGKKLLSTQTFRNLFRSEAIGSQEGLDVKDLTYLFTDLSGSTALYEEIGDPQAYDLVRRHFDVLAGVVKENKGAVVKTIGDAILASFPDPLDAVSAALAMLGEFDAFNRNIPQALLLKIGIHKGHALAVMLNERIDYFGQAVNVAARIQSLAGAREIWISQDVYDVPGADDLLAGHEVTALEVTLRGMSENMLVYKLV